MKYTYHKGIFWLVLYVALALLPLLLTLAGYRPEARHFTVELGVAFGFIGLGMLGMQFLFSGRIRAVAPSFGMDNLLQYHREMGIIAWGFILAHPLLLLLANPEFISYLDPRVNAPRAVALVFVVVAGSLLVATSLWRLRFRLSYEYWRLLHGLLSLAVLFIGVVHSVQVSHYLNPLWKQLLLLLLFGGYGYLVIHTRLMRPWLSRKRPYEVKAVIPERGDSWTLELEPCGHAGMDFRCGQFAWITLGPTPFTLQQHPFSLSSPQGEKRLAMTAKVLGDFTATWKDINPGTRAFLEGPFGSFTAEEGRDLFLVMGGIGITPAMSMLRTLRRERDRRKVVLVYANTDWEGITYREELAEIEREINLKLVHVLTDPPDGWQGETGLIDRPLLDKYLPANVGEVLCFICGPQPFMDEAELIIRNLGVNWRRVYTERFEVI